jgi:hypothetical protein
LHLKNVAGRTSNDKPLWQWHRASQFSCCLLETAGCSDKDKNARAIAHKQNGLPRIFGLFNESEASRASSNVPEVQICQPISSDPGVLKALRKTAEQMAVRFNLVNTGAGCDTSALARCCYLGAIVFIRQPEPISHNPEEAPVHASFRNATALLAAFCVKPFAVGDSSPPTRSTCFVTELN